MSKKIDRIEAKKKELEANLEKIQDGIEDNLVNVRSDVTQSINPTEVIRKYPLPSVATAMVVGFLLTTIGRSSSNKKKTSTKAVVADSLTNSLKKRISKKAVDIALDYIEDKISNNKE